MILFRPRQETKEQTSWKRRNAKIVEKVPEEMEIPEKSKEKEKLKVNNQKRRLENSVHEGN